MNSFRTLLLLILLFLLPGCMMSGRISSEINIYSQSINEFQSSSEEKILVCDGNYAGMVREKDELYQRYVFQNALESSDSRNLLIFVPIITDEQYGIAKITETPETLQANGSAKMIVMPGTDNNPNDFLKGIIEYSDFNFSEYDGDLIIVQKPFLGVAFDHIFFVREKNGVNTSSWRKIPTNVNLDWKARDRHEVSKKRMKYLYTVPLDILTFPIQFLMMITWVFGDD